MTVETGRWGQAVDWPWAPIVWWMVSGAYILYVSEGVSPLVWLLAGVGLLALERTGIIVGTADGLVVIRRLQRGMSGLAFVAVLVTAELQERLIAPSWWVAVAVPLLAVLVAAPAAVQAVVQRAAMALLVLLVGVVVVLACHHLGVGHVTSTIRFSSLHGRNVARSVGELLLMGVGLGTARDHRTHSPHSFRLLLGTGFLLVVVMQMGVTTMPAWGHLVDMVRALNVAWVGPILVALSVSMVLPSLRARMTDRARGPLVGIGVVVSLVVVLAPLHFIRSFDYLDALHGAFVVFVVILCCGALWTLARGRQGWVEFVPVVLTMAAVVLGAAELWRLGDTSTSVRATTVGGAITLVAACAGIAVASLVSKVRKS
jgi:hypothetical protein